MCELFELSATAPVDVLLSLARLAQHGGGTAPHGDGWGVAFLEGRDALLFRGAEAAYTSALVQCLARLPIKSTTVVAHIRRATRGRIALANTQPFQRELWGRAHVFAHNGDVLFDAIPSSSAQQRFRPIGDTDSEVIFCRFLDEFAARAAFDSSWIDHMALEWFGAFCRQVRMTGPANIIYASANRLLVHADRRRQTSGRIDPPGLWMLTRRCNPAQQYNAADGAISIAGTALKVVLIASVPLTDEAWHPLERGVVLDIKEGEIMTQLAV